MSDIEVRTLTRNGEPDGEPIGVGYYLPGWKDTRPRRCWGNDYPSGAYRRVWVDSEGRSLMIGWFLRSCV
ncbi:hypothetical protein ACFQ7W_05485 [Streptomyces niveus]|uniref:hypothetical protein n=1 Tax=Streptomyces niveus TaxID=193462 RepID=UPI0036831972